MKMGQTSVSRAMVFKCSSRLIFLYKQCIFLLLIWKEQKKHGILSNHLLCYIQTVNEFFFVFVHLTNFSQQNSPDRSIDIAINLDAEKDSSILSDKVESFWEQNSKNRHRSSVFITTFPIIQGKNIDDRVIDKACLGRQNQSERQMMRQNS